MSTTSIVKHGHINNGPGYPCQVNVEHNPRVEWSSSPKADESWSFVDAAGHFHAYDQSRDKYVDRYPTLLTRIERIPCDHYEHDADCDGANITHYHCRICDEEVTPGLIPGPHSFLLPGLSEWHVKLTMPTEGLSFGDGEQVSFRMEAGDTELFGIAYVTRVEHRVDETVTLDLSGAGPLGRRKTKARVAA